MTLASPLLTLPPALLAQSSGGLSEAFGRSGPMAVAVLGLLALFSLGSWAILLWKLVHFRRARGQSRTFLGIFRNSKRFSEVSAATGRVSASPLVGVFQAGYSEIEAQIRALGDEGGGAQGRYRIKSLAGVERSLRRAVAAETHLLARGASFLATTAAGTPFIGLFGTVWGIMRAFEDIGRTGSTSLVAVAPGIAEALINTAAGLGAAIPALLGYNYLANQLKRHRVEMEDFALEFLNLAERNFTGWPS
jgi:biopolymer transport protein TolQ